MAKAFAALLFLLFAVPAQAFERMDQPRRAWPAAKLVFHHHMPDALPPAGAALVVVLHGCGQDWRDYAEESGWRDLAERHRFALVAASYKDVASDCLPWFWRPFAHDVADAVAEAVAKVRARIGPGPNFVTGLSAGGAQAVAVLARHPDVFQAGGIVAGLAYGCTSFRAEYRRDGKICRPADMVCRAQSCMAHGFDASPAQWAAMMPSAQRPRLYILHGTDDERVACANALALAAQWTGHDPGPCEPGVRDIGPIRLEVVPDLGHAQPEGAAERMAEWWGVVGGQ